MIIQVRDATLADVAVIVDFNARLADETESKTLDREVLAKGVAAALADSDRLRYWVAEVDGGVVGQTAITREWSDWRNGWIWWLQSVYVLPEARGSGVFRALHAHIRAKAAEDATVIGLRLYVEHENKVAQNTYLHLGMSPGNYHVLEELWINRPRPDCGAV